MDWHLFFTLVAGHYLADFALQTQFMAEKKAKAFIEPIGFHVLMAHAAIHGLIDFGKASDLIDNRFPHTAGARKFGQTHGLYGIYLDQTLHILVLLIATIALS
jgi:hypothetical protein